MRKTLTHALIAVFFGTGGIGSKPVPSQAVPAKSPKPAEPQIFSKQVTQPAARLVTVKGDKRRDFEVGPASWYGEDFDGQPTASGEVFDMYDLTCAHPRLPFGTWVRVTNLRNKRTVEVRVNDRGPMVPGRIVDLSYQAAEELGFHGRGMARVRLEVVHPRTVATAVPVAYSLR